MGSYDSLHAFFWSCGGMSILPVFFLIVTIFGGQPSNMWPQPPLGIVLVYVATAAGYGIGWLAYRLTHDGIGWGSGSSGDDGPSGYDNDGAPLD